MKHLLATGCCTWILATFGTVPSVWAQQGPPCPYCPQTDTTQLSGSIDSSTVQVIGITYYWLNTPHKLDGLYHIRLYRRFSEPNPSTNQYWERIGSDEGQFLDGLKEGPWRCRRSVPVETSWWECYHAGRLVSSTALPLVPEKKQRKRKVPRRSFGALGRKSETILRRWV